MILNLNATILGQLISFVLFVWFCMKYVWPPIISAIETRQKEIEKSLACSKKAKEELLLVQEDMQRKINDAKIKASVILNNAHKKRLLILEKAKNEALEKSKKIIMNAHSEIEIQMISARQELHKEIANLSINMAEKIIKKEIIKNKKNFADELIVSLSQVKN